jgi:hypothetical protein
MSFHFPSGLDDLAAAAQCLVRPAQEGHFPISHYAAIFKQRKSLLAQVGVYKR